MVRCQLTVLILVASYLLLTKAQLLSFRIARTKLIYRLLGSSAV
jgi:hypothetical protein